MKAQKKPFIVEVKNRRRQSSSNHSIWGTIDLKAACHQVAVEQMAGSHETVAPEQSSETATGDLTGRSA